ENDPEIELNILFRNYLLDNDVSRNEYEKLKYQLVKNKSSHLKKDGAIYREYTLEKGDFIHEILRRTEFNRLRMIICTNRTEWEKVKYFREKYFFGPYGVEDPDSWTFDHKEHTHLVLYEGVDIIGYAHIQFWNDKRAAIRIIIIDEEKRSKDLGSTFLSLIEKWLKMQDIKSIHAEPGQSSLNFYLKNGYSKISFDDPESYESDSKDIAVCKIL
ncbi:MAG: GNAT family N-acetyltransferase, partial [Rickettsiales bacterium]